MNTDLRIHRHNQRIKTGKRETERDNICIYIHTYEPANTDRRPAQAPT